MTNSDYSGKIMDAHMHLWDRANGYPWLDENIFKGKLEGNFLVDDYLAISKNQNISKAVHVECHGFSHDPVLETEWIQKISDQFGIPQGIVGYASLHHPEIETELKRHCEYPNMRGIRMNLRYGSKGFFLTDRGNYMQDKEWQRGFSLLSKYHLRFDMQIYPEQIPDAIRLLKVYNDIPVILDHLALPYEPNEENFDSWAENIKQIAEIPNTYMKLSGIGVFFQNTNNLTLIVKYITQAIESFGVNRCLFASNCPPDAAFIPFDSIFEIYKKIAINFSEKERYQLFYENASRVYDV